MGQILCRRHCEKVSFAMCKTLNVIVLLVCFNGASSSTEEWLDDMCSLQMPRLATKLRDHEGSCPLLARPLPVEWQSL